MSDKQKRFYEQYNKAKQKRQNGYLKQSRNDYIYILKNQHSNQICFTDYISMIGQLGDIERELKYYIDSKNTYYRGIGLLNQFKNFTKQVPQYQIQKQKYHLHSNLGLTYCAEAQSINQKSQKYDVLKSLIDSSIKHYRICQKIVVRMIVQGKNQGEQKRWWWKNQYIALIVNMTNSVQIQAFQFKQDKILKQIISLIDNAQKFFGLCRRKTRNHLQKNISKCYYSKALALKFLDNEKQCEQYFKKDYQYCQQNNLTEDLKKTCDQLRRFYVQTFMFKKAREYAKSSEQKLYINDAQKTHDDVMRKVFQMKRKVQRNFDITQQDLEDVLYRLYEYPNLKQKALEFNKKLRTCKQFKSNAKIRYLLQYYAADTYFKMKQYTEASRYLNLAMDLAHNWPAQVIWSLLLQASISDKVQKDIKQVSKLFLNCLQKSRTTGDQSLVQQCLNKLNQFNLSQKRRNRQFNFQTQESRVLFQYMTKQRFEGKNRPMENQHDSKLLMISELEVEQFYEPQRKLIRSLNPTSLYWQSCQMLNIEPLQKFKELLFEGKQIHLDQYIFYPIQQIQALFKSSPNIYNLDLRNLAVSTNFFKVISQSQNIHNVKKIKVNLINGSFLQGNDRKQFFREFHTVLKLTPFLEELSISNVYDYQQIETLIHSQQLPNLRQIMALKLKECQLEDKHLMYLNLAQKLPQLKRLSLSGNNLQGNTLDCLTTLKNLQSLTLSSNPLTSVNLSRGFQRLRKISLNNLSSTITESSCQSFIALLLNSQIINLKNCERVSMNILQSLIICIINNQRLLAFLKLINLSGSILVEDQIVQILERYLNLSPKLQWIDLSNCKIIQRQTGRQTKKELERVQHFYKKVKLNNLKFIQEKPKIKPNKFSIF